MVTTAAKTKPAEEHDHDDHSHDHDDHSENAADEKPEENDSSDHSDDQNDQSEDPAENSEAKDRIIHLIECSVQVQKSKNGSLLSFSR